MTQQRPQEGEGPAKVKVYDTPDASSEQSGAHIYETEGSAKPATTRGVYDAPTRGNSLPLGLIIGGIVLALLVLYLLFQFVF